MLASVTTFSLRGVDALRVTVEVDVRPGLPTFAIVGLGDTAVRESRERVRAALDNSGFAFPQRAVYDKPAAERHWERVLALFRRNLS